jgi:hypothetical protein
MTDAQLRVLLLDCLKLWEVKGKVTMRETNLAIETPGGAAAGRPPRAAPSIVALLSALRNAMEGTGGDRLRIGGA